MSGPKGSFAHGPIVTLQVLDRGRFLAVELQDGDVGSLKSGGVRDEKRLYIPWLRE
jgi:hypothetical protein